MNWGSVWEFTDYTRQNWWNLWIEEEEEANLGGSSFGDTQQERSNAPNPFLRVKPPQSSPAVVSEEVSDESARSDLVYATENFDRRQRADSDETDSRWLADRRGLQVPVLDDRLVVAFQKFLRDEEQEFLLLLIAAEEDVVNGHEL